MGIKFPSRKFEMHTQYSEIPKEIFAMDGNFMFTSLSMFVPGCYSLFFIFNIDSFSYIFLSVLEMLHVVHVIN